MQVAAIGPMGAMIFSEFAESCRSQAKPVPVMVDDDVPDRDHRLD